MALHDPPPGYEDCAFDAERTPIPEGGYRTLTVEGVGELLARPPVVHSVSVLGAATRANISADRKIDQLTRFLQIHLADGEYARLLMGMATGEMPADTIARVHRAIAAWGTARPTVPSSH